MKNLKLFKNSHEFNGEIDKFNGRITKAIIESKKLAENKSIRTITIADLHGYTNNEEKARRLAEAIKRENPELIFIAGDLFNGGTPWEGGEKLANLRKFISILSEAAPVFITWGNHDLRKMNPANQNTRISNLRNLESVRSGMVYPLYNDKVIVNGMEIIGYVPSFGLMEGEKLEGLPIQIHGIAHDKFIQEYEENGVKFEHPELITTYLGHDPHLIAASENEIGLGSLSLCDFFITGHLHDGYKPVLQYLESLKTRITGSGLESFEYDRGWVEQPTLFDKNGRKIKKPLWPPFFGKTNLCRGIIYFDDNAQQKIWQSQEGRFYKNVATGDNRQIWRPISEKSARAEILNDKLHYMLISEGIAPGFAPKEELATINIIDFQSPAKVKKI